MNNGRYKYVKSPRHTIPKDLQKKLQNSHLVLVAEDVIVDIVLLGALWSENKGLHEPPHRLPVVRQLTAHLFANHAKYVQIISMSIRQ